MSQTTSKDNKNYAIQKFRKATFEIPTGRPVRKSGYKYISYGDDNKYPIFLDNLRQQAQHSKILSSKIDWIAKEGFELEELSSDQQEWLVENDIDDFIFNITRDLETYGGFSFYVIMSRDGSTVTNLEYQDFSKVRVAAEDDNEDESDNRKFLIGEDWSKYRTDVEEVEEYDPENPVGRSLFYFTGNSKEIYPEPPYYGCLADLQTSLEIKNFHLSHVKNGFFIPTIIQYNNGIPDQDRQDELVREVEAAFTGTDNTGRILVAFNNDSESAITIDSFEPTELDKMFETLNKEIKENVYEAHGIHPIVFGHATEGALGQRNEMVAAFQMFYTTYIKPQQKQIIGVLKSVLSRNWEDLELKLTTIPPLEEETDKDVLTIYEKRELQGIDDSELTDLQRTSLMLKDLPSEVRTKFVESLSVEQLHQLVGYESTENEITDENEDLENE